MNKYTTTKIIALLGLTLLFSGCSTFNLIGLSTPVDESKSPLYYYNWFHTKIFLAPTAAFESKEELKDADVKTFTVINRYYAKDAKHIFFKSKQIKGANPKTARLPLQYFKNESDELSHDYWLIDDKHVYLWGKIIDADPNSFKAWTMGGGSFGIDKDSIFCNHKKMPGNSKGFKHLFESYFINNSALYTLSGNACYYIDNVNTDSISTFTFDDGVKSNLYIKDKNKVYCLDKKMSVMTEADPKTFQVIKNYFTNEYAKDKHNVYINCEIATPQESTCILKGGVINYISKNTRQCIFKDKSGKEIKCSLKMLYGGKCNQ